MNFSDPYGAYTEGAVTSGGPFQMVIALYEKAIECIRQAKGCLGSGDIAGRSKLINKALQILTELLVSLDHEKGGEVSANLQRLYSYVQCRLLDAHTQQKKGPLEEAERLLVTMLEGWQGAAEKTAAEERATGIAAGASSELVKEEEVSGGGRYWEEVGEYSCAGVSATF